VTAYASLDTSVKALRAGAYDYIMKPIIHEEIKQVVRNALKQKNLQAENVRLKREIGKAHDFSGIIGDSPSIKSILAEVRKVTDTRSNVLLLGETGTGKELFARVIHHNSSRREMPFVPINCSAIPENLLETELFGHVRGAFTGAVATKRGLLEEADGGTVFLDEIGDMSLPLQAKLLRVIEDQVIRPVGSTKGTKVDIRFITATNQDLRAAVKSGIFREDLYYRINVISLRIPPLRDRQDDIRLLVSYYLEKYGQEMGKPAKGVSDEALGLMVKYEWPGNVRELQNVVERAILLAEDGTITPECLPDGVRADGSFNEEVFEQKLTIEDYTKAFIVRYQKHHNEQQIADMLGITRKSLWEKRKKWGIPRER
jgi:DNA-binding NtrC family response regulator